MSMSFLLWNFWKFLCFDSTSFINCLKKVFFVQGEPVVLDDEDEVEVKEIACHEDVDEW